MSVLNCVINASLVCMLTVAVVGDEARSAANLVKREPECIEILTRVIQASGGMDNIKAIRDLTATGEVKSYSSQPPSGQVTLSMRSTSDFRMDIEGTRERRKWMVANGRGFRIENDRRIPMSQDAASNLVNLVYPLSQIVSALADPRTSITFQGIESHNKRQAYRLRIKNKGVNARPGGAEISKDLIIDALNFDVLYVEDHPFFRATTRQANDLCRTITFRDFRATNGVRMPYEVSTRLMGQLAMKISITHIAVNSGLGREDFVP